MPEGILSLLEEIERLADYNGPWRALREEASALRRGAAELRERMDRLDDVLIVALVGGSGVGKSTLLNAIAGDQIAETSEMRPCTAVPMIYHPPGARLDFDAPEDSGRAWKSVPRSALEHLILIDTPDSDTIVREHRETVIRTLEKCDLILMCGSQEKYLDEATWSLLRPLRGERAIVCVETKATAHAALREHWLSRLQAAGIEAKAYFRVHALHTLDRKLNGLDEEVPGQPEFDFPALDRFLRQELTRERIARIKRSNVTGLIRRITKRLAAHAEGQVPEIERLRALIHETDATIAAACHDYLRVRIFAAPHLWMHALGREISLRAKGLMGMLYRVVEWLRSLPARLPALFSWGALRDSAGRGAIALLRDEGDGESADLAPPTLLAIYDDERGKVSLALAQAGFDPPNAAQSAESFQKTLNARLASALGGPVRERVLRAARLLTSWPLTLIADAPPLAFLCYAGWKVVRTYVSAPLLPTAFFLHTGAVCCILVGGELLVMSLAVRFFAAMARRGGLRDLKIAVQAPGLGLRLEQAVVEEAAMQVESIRRLAARFDSMLQ